VERPTGWPAPGDSGSLERLRALGSESPSVQPTQFQMPIRPSPAGSAQPAGSDLAPAIATAKPPLPALRVLGQVGAMYIVAEGPEGMYLIDQHAAHERVLYEKFMAEHAQRSLAVQNLLEPRPVEVPTESVELLTEHLDLLAGIGLTLEPFGGTTFLVRSVPAILAREDPRSVMADVLAEIDAGDVPMQADEEARLIIRVCKRAAIKAGQTLAMAEMQELIRQLEACAAPRTCPHGRPTMIHLSADQLAREFGRR